MTLIEAPAQLQQWIKELDGQIGFLNEQRDALVQALGLIGGESLIEAVVPRPERPVVSERDFLAEVAEKRRAADRDRKARARAKQPPKTKTATTVKSKYDYAEVAQIACSAVREGVPLGPAIAKHYGVSGSMGAFLINEARRRGHNIPRLGANKPLKLVSEHVNHAPTGGPVFTPDDALGLLGG